MSAITRPDRTEAGEYYFTYIDEVREGDIRRILETQSDATLVFLNEISEVQSLNRYGPDKWSIREVVGHVNDCERMFVFRALWFARGFDSELPSFDQNVAAGAMEANDRSWRSHIDEFRAVRSATLSFFNHLPEAAWTRTGIASGFTFSVRALAYITAGHVTHHVRLIRERYL